MCHFYLSNILPAKSKSALIVSSLRFLFSFIFIRHRSRSSFVESGTTAAHRRKNPVRSKNKKKITCPAIAKNRFSEIVAILGIQKKRENCDENDMCVRFCWFADRLLALRYPKHCRRTRPNRRLKCVAAAMTSTTTQEQQKQQQQQTQREMCLFLDIF